MSSGESAVAASPEDDVTRTHKPNFGRYTVLDRLGSGGMADVYLALSVGAFESRKLVVLKRPHVASGAAEMFMDEARLAMRLNHPNVVSTYDVGVQDGSLFLAMEYLEGQPLHRLMQELNTADVHLPRPHVARIASDALAGLHYAHELRDYDGTPLHIVHRDVSPHNLFVTYEGQVKVVDFGIAKATSNQARTDTGSIKGKLAYMSPEHAEGQALDGRADVFAMGIILWELLARRRLLTGVSSAEVLRRLLTMEFPKLEDEADVPPQLAAIAERALKRDPAERFATALDMHDALEEYIAGSGRVPRASELGTVVSTLFAAAREQMALKVRAQIKSTVSVPPPPISGPALPDATATGSGVRPSGTTDAAEVATAVGPPRTRGDGKGPVTPRTGRAALAAKTESELTPTTPAKKDARIGGPLLLLALSIFVLAGALIFRTSGTATGGATTATAITTPTANVTTTTTAPQAATATVPVLSASASAAPPATITPALIATIPTKAVSSAVPSSAPRAPRPIDTSFPQ